MKKLILFFTLLSVTTVSYSQKSFSLTFLTSPQVTWLSSDSKEVKADGSFLGFGYGVEGDFYLGNESYSLVTGLTVSTTGGSLVYRNATSFDGEQLPAGTKVDYFLKYLEIPFAVRMFTKDFNRTRFYAQFGLTNWLNIKTKATTSNRSFEKEAVNDETTFYNVGLNVGAGLAYDLGRGNALTAGLIYSNGLNDLTTNKVSDSVLLKSLRLRLGFVF